MALIETHKCIDYMYKHAMFKFYHVIYNVDYVILACNILKDDVRLCWKKPIQVSIM